LALLASPLLGPAVWSPVAAELRHRGWSVVEPPPYVEVSGPDDVLGHLLGAIPQQEPVVLVPHSNAGLYVAALADRLDARGVVFVDAGLPGEGPATPTAPPAFRQFLSGLVDRDGLLPVWTQWWPTEELDGLFPDSRSRAAVESEQQRLPIGYFDAAVPSPAAWRDLPAAYLAFGDTYAGERASAEELGWPTATLPGQHLHALADPAGVVDALVGLLGQMGIEGA
jgi:hypothetical protein